MRKTGGSVVKAPAQTVSTIAPSPGKRPGGGVSTIAPASSGGQILIKRAVDERVRSQIADSPAVRAAAGLPTGSISIVRRPAGRLTSAALAEIVRESAIDDGSRPEVMKRPAGRRRAHAPRPGISVRARSIRSAQAATACDSSIAGKSAIAQQQGAQIINRSAISGAAVTTVTPAATENGAIPAPAPRSTSATGGAIGQKSAVDGIIRALIEYRASQAVVTVATIAALVASCSVFGAGGASGDVCTHAVAPAEGEISYDEIHAGIHNENAIARTAGDADAVRGRIQNRVMGNVDRSRDGDRPAEV